MKLKHLFEKDVYKQENEKFRDYDFDEFVDDSYKEYGTYQDLKHSVADVLSTLSPREERVLRYLFGINLDKEYTPSEISKIMGLSITRITQIRNKALRKMRSPTRARRLLGYIDPNILSSKSDYDYALERELKVREDEEKRWLEKYERGY